MNARPILIALVAAAALILFCLRFVGGPTEGGAGLVPDRLASEEPAGAAEAIVGGARREERVGAGEGAPVAEEIVPLEASVVDERAEREPDAEAATVVRGTCFDAATRTPVAGVAIHVGGVSVTSGDDGAFELAWPSRGDTTHLVVQHASYVEQRVPVERARAVAEGDEPVAEESADAVVRVEIHLRHGLPLELEVVDGDTGSPVVGATLAGASEAHPCAVSDGRGRLGLQVLPGSSFEATIAADGYAVLRWSWRVDEARADDGDVVALVPAAWIDGRVVDGDGRGIERAAAVAFQQETRTREYADAVAERWGDVLVPGELRYRMGPDGRGAVDADANGAFRLPVPPSGSPYTVRASRRGYVAAAVDGVVADAPGKRAEVEIVLAHGASIEGRVTRNDAPWDGELVATDAGGRRRGVAVRGGRYRIGDLASGALRLTLESSFTGAVVVDETVELEPGVALEKDLAFQEPVATIEGRVVRANGEPAADVVVGARPDERGARSDFWERTDEQGFFALEVPPGGSFDLSAYDRVARVWRRDVQAGARDVTLVLGETGTLELELVDAATRTPIATDQRRFLSWVAQGDLRPHRVTARLAGDGTTTLTLPAGRIALTVDLTSLGYARKTLDNVLVRPGGDTLRIALERGVDVRFRLAARDSRRLRRHAVFLLEETQRNLVRGPFASATDANTRVNGRRLWVDPSVARQQVDLGRGRTVVLQGLVPGRYVLRAFPDDVRLEPSTIDLTRTGIAEVELELVR